MQTYPDKRLVLGGEACEHRALIGILVLVAAKKSSVDPEI